MGWLFISIKPEKQKSDEERFFTTDEAIIKSGIKEREQIKQSDFKMAATALKGLGYFQDEKRVNGIKARWWFKRM